MNLIKPVNLRNLTSWKAEAPFVKEGDPAKVQLQFVDLAPKNLPPSFVFN